MRQGQQHRRNRGRGGHNPNQHSSNNNNRKIQNPLSRTYHSNGPDGKVSGSPQSIADKYLSLARDALLSGDPVLAENYLQHAEHYNRIILAYREQVAQSHDAANGGSAAPRSEPDYGPDFPDEDTDSLGRDLSPLPPEQPRQRPEQQPQPRFDQGPPRDGQNFQDRQPRHGRDRFGDRDRFQGSERGERFGPRPNQPAYGPDGQLLQSDRPQREGARDDRPRDDRSDRQRDDRPRDDRPDRQRDDRGRDRHFRPNGPRFDHNRGDGPRNDIGPRNEMGPRDRDIPREVTPVEPVPEAPRVEAVAVIPAVEAAEVRAPRRRERGPALAEDAQPDFLRRPVRRPRREAASEEPAAEAPARSDDSGTE